jgi:hypothetical protein
VAELIMSPATKLNVIPIGIDYVVPRQSIHAKCSAGDHPSCRFNALEGRFERGDIEHGLEGWILAWCRRGAGRNVFANLLGNRMHQDFVAIIEEPNISRRFNSPFCAEHALVEDREPTYIDRKHDE